MDQLTINLVCVLVSGTFSLVAACVPSYLASRKPPEVVLREIQRGEYQRYSFWHLLLGVSLPLACIFLMTIYAGFYSTAGMMMMAHQTPDPSALLQQFDIEKSAAVARSIGSIELILLCLPMFAVFLFTARFLGHRFGRKAPWFVALTVLIVLAIQVAVPFAMQSAALPAVDIARNAVVGAAVYSVAAIIGVRWARKTRQRFLITRVFERLPPQDRQAFFDLAESLIPGPRKSE